MLTTAEAESRDVCVLFFKGSRSGLQMCTRTEAREGIINAYSSPMVSLFASMNLYNRDYSERPDEAVQEFVNAFIKQ